ncbi:transglutaminase-like domain-containing protein [Alicyclobacillus fodiniaquatilis]|uniref:Transglutaminase-like domain-containing protein n=1 Tax=Alicyclobacillus fodiniaquatilis TaxID=1661150 RepID=A0ABW4JDF7_9BACL
MDRRFQWSLLEYRHTEKSCFFDEYIWANEPELRAYVRRETGLQEVLSSIESEWNQILKMMDWVNNLSAHQGINEAPDLGALQLLQGVQAGTVTFRCVEFAHMFQHILSAYGIPARVIGVRRPDSHIGLGKGHVVVDVWSNDFQKWIVLDPQLNTFYTDHKGTPLSVFELHDRVRAGMFDDIIMSRGSELSVELDGVEARDNTNYDSLEVPVGFERDEIWESLPEHGDFAGFVRFWQEYYHQFVVRRTYRFNRAKSESGSSGGNELYYYASHEMPPIVFQRMRQTCEYTCERSKIDFPINGAEIQWTPIEVTEETPIEDTRRITLHLKHSMPWFDHFDVIANGEHFRLNKNETDIQLQADENCISITPVNDSGRRGSTSVVKMYVN